MIRRIAWKAVLVIVRLVTLAACIGLAAFCVWLGTELAESGNDWGGLLSFGGAIAATLIWVAVCAWTENKGQNVVLDYYVATINYVHELQHARRLCGLNELADNFKI